MDVAAEIERRLRAALAPVHLKVEDISEAHRGHAGWRPGGATHFRIDIAAAAFAGMSRVARERAVQAAVGDLMGAPVHALTVRARLPEEG